MQINGNWGLPWSKVDCGCLEEAGGLCLSAGGPGERTILGEVSLCTRKAGVSGGEIGC